MGNVAGIVEETLRELARELVSSSNLNDYYRSFSWGGVGLPPAWQVRQELEKHVGDYFEHEGDPYPVANRIHRWGFGADIPTKFNTDKFNIGLRNLFHEWHKPTGAGAKLETLITLLSIPGIGIARVSKWICFIDQKRYGIYDSRVSLGLRHVCLAGCRLFPIVGRRALKGRRAWQQDFAVGRPDRMARYYCHYLKFLRSVSGLVVHSHTESANGREFYPAEVEMALFMLGDVWPDGEPKLPLIKDRLFE